MSKPLGGAPLIVGRFGIFDTKDGLWLGNDNQPLVYGDLVLARIAAQVMEDQVFNSDLGGRFVAQELPNGSWKKRDDLKTNRTPLESLRRIENSAEPTPSDNGSQREPIVLRWNEVGKTWKDETR